jgi:hypothetical protein
MALAIGAAGLGHIGVESLKILSATIIVPRPQPGP